jgi:hypothetical protein
VAALETDLPWTRVPRADVLYVVGPAEAAVAAAAFGGVPVGESRTADGRVEWALFRIPFAAAREAAHRAAERFVLEPPDNAGALEAPEEGLYLFRATGFRVRRLAAGRHRVEEAPPGAPLTVWGPDGFILPPLQ